MGNSRTQLVSTGFFLFCAIVERRTKMQSLTTPLRVLYVDNHQKFTDLTATYLSGEDTRRR